jgi:hypothetical protein
VSIIAIMELPKILNRCMDQKLAPLSARSDSGRRCAHFNTAKSLKTQSSQQRILK